MFVWRSNLLGSSGKGHEYFLKHLLGTTHGVLGKDLGETGEKKPKEVAWHDEAPEGKLDLLVTLDFRMSTTCVYSDIVLPTATWYEKNDLNTSDMHPVHPSADRGGRSGVGVQERLGHLQGDRQEILRGRAGGARRREGRRADADPARHAGRDRAGARRQGLEEGRGRADPRQDHAGGHRGRARLSQSLQALHRARPADGEARQRRQGHGLEHRARGRFPQAAQRRGHRGRRDQGAGQDRDRHRRHRGDPDAGAGDQRRGRGQGLGVARRDSPAASTRISRSRRRTRRSASATSSRSRARSSRRRSGRAWSRRRSATTPATPTSTS